MKQTIVFFGSGKYTLPVVEKLSKHNLSLVISTEKNGALYLFCDVNSIPYIYSHLKEKEVVEKIKNLNPTVAVLASYGALIPKEVIDLFPNGIINIHPSLLPNWKGPSPIQYTLLSGATQTEVSLIKLDNEIDHGPILLQKPYNLTGDETTEDLLSILFEIGAEMVEEEVIKLENGETLVEIPQDHSRETWSYKVEKKDGMINLSSIPDKEKLKNMIKAYFPWPGVWLTIPSPSGEGKGEENGVEGLNSDPGSTPPRHSELSEESRLSGKIIKLLPENRIQVEGKNAMNYKDFVNGFGDEGKEILEKLKLV